MRTVFEILCEVLCAYCLWDTVWSTVCVLSLRYCVKYCVRTVFEILCEVLCVRTVYEVLYAYCLWGTVCVFSMRYYVSTASEVLCVYCLWDTVCVLSIRYCVRTICDAVCACCLWGHVRAVCEVMCVLCVYCVWGMMCALYISYVFILPVTYCVRIVFEILSACSMWETVCEEFVCTCLRGTVCAHCPAGARARTHTHARTHARTHTQKLKRFLRLSPNVNTFSHTSSVPVNGLNPLTMRPHHRQETSLQRRSVNEYSIILQPGRHPISEQCESRDVRDSKRELNPASVRCCVWNQSANYKLISQRT